MWDVGRGEEEKRRGGRLLPDAALSVKWSFGQINGI
jgi:hypothetical protein